MPAKEELKASIRALPDKPGIYKFFSVDEKLIYVGKAKNIKKRVASYFNKIAYLDNKTKRLVNQIKRIEFTIVNSEYDAYLLENNLIKTYKPKFNILLKDDKTYPYLYISNERFPRLISSRKQDSSLGKHYGPYTSVKAMNTVMTLIQKLFAVRACSYNLSEKNVQKGKYKVCLEYHIGNCKGPCENLIQEEEYNNNILQIHQILKGKLTVVRSYFKEKMEQSAAALKFEKAQVFKEKLVLLEKFQSGSIIVNPKISDLDVITIASEQDVAVVNYFCVTDGLIVKTKTIEIRKRLDESNQAILLTALFSLREDLETENKEVLTNIPINEAQEIGLNIYQPIIGDKKKLVDLSYKNALFKLKKVQEASEEKIPYHQKVMLSLQKDLQLKSIPLRIECFDNSNIQGTNPVAAMVSFIKGKPAKKEYRHYTIKTVTGPDDFASMYEIITRRYKRQIEEEKQLPELIIIDGGKGQLNAACMALRDLNIYGKIPIIGIAKRLEEIFFPGDKFPLFLDKRSPSLKLIQQIRDETHRFAITFHRKKRSASVLKSSLTEIPGIGKETFRTLIQRFKTISEIKQQSVETLAKEIGLKKAESITAFFKAEKIEIKKEA